MNAIDRIKLMRQDSTENHAREKDDIGTAWYASRTLAFDQVLAVLEEEQRENAAKITEVSAYYCGD